MNPVIRFFLDFELTLVITLYGLAILAGILLCIYWMLKDPVDEREPLL
jgi:hypothetical protein